MNPITIEWIDKAEGDYNTAQRELRARKSPNYDAVCFHAQQTAEKYLKAVLQEHEVHVPKTHQLLDLLGLCRKINSVYEIIYSDLVDLEGYAIRFRYPGESADRNEALNAVKAARRVREFIRNQLGMEQNN